MALLSLKNISFAYMLGTQSVKVLDGVELAVARGDFVAIQGPSGSGKSTLLYLMGCLLHVQQGKMEIDGLDVSHFSETELAFLRSRKIGFVFQQFHLLPRANVLDNILLPTLYPCEEPPLYRDPETRARALAAKVGLEDRLDHLPNQLSGGQQQRVAIARALMNDPDIIFADEPTGNLDSRSSEQIMDLLAGLNREGKTIVLITHDPGVAEKCSTVYKIRDGKITGQIRRAEPVTAGAPSRKIVTRASSRTPFAATLAIASKLFPSAIENLRRNRIRTFLTMLGITIGIGAVFSMITLGQFTKRKILDSYADLGVNTLSFYGSPNWESRAADLVPNVFRYFDWRVDLKPMPRIFPQIARMSPMLSSWDGAASFGGRKVEADVRIMGVNEHGIALLNRTFAAGKDFNPHHIENRSPVCIIGFDIAQKLFTDTKPVGSMLNFTFRKGANTCKVIGVLKPMQSNKEWMKPNTQIFLPFTYFQIASDYWSSLLHQALIEIKRDGDIEQTSRAIRAFFEAKYGKSGRFRVDSDSLLVNQMNRFLSLFSILLTAIALVCLAVGGIGIANMMLVSVSERFREIGLRKALGATPRTIRTQFLLESLVVCALAGIVGLVAGFAIYETGLWAATKLVPKVQFEWIINWGALGISGIAILCVGIASGLFPAIKAERLQVVEALRSE
ncbi:MAG: ATP-binding cassette domain-containing protein [Bacteriovoracia bacterium]